jgi:hypothetical protein
LLIVGEIEEGTTSRKTFLKLVLAGVLTACSPRVLCAQDLAPRAYIVTPIHSNAVTLTYSFSDGGISINNVLPVTGGTGVLHVPVFNYYHSLNFFGRSANVLVALPYGVAHYQGTFKDNETKVYRSGLLDSVYRFSVNLKGGPAMSVKEYQSWQQKTILGVSLKVVAPTGQYDATKLINNGGNRWAFQPQFGYSERWGHWVLDGYAAVTFFTTNPEFFSHNAFFPGTQTQSQTPIVSFEGHLSYDVKRRLWISLDGNFWHGGTTSLNGVENPNTVQTSSRLGVTASVPFFGKHQSLKISYSDGDYVRFGGNFQNVAIAWQYSWLGRPN